MFGDIGKVLDQICGGWKPEQTEFTPCIEAAMPSTSDGSTPGTPDATLRLSSLVTQPEMAGPAALQAATDDLSGLLAQLPTADEQRRLLVDAGTMQREQMGLFLLQQITPEDGSL